MSGNVTFTTQTQEERYHFKIEVHPSPLGHQELVTVKVPTVSKTTSLPGVKILSEFQERYNVHTSFVYTQIQYVLSDYIYTFNNSTITTLL